MLRSGEKQNAEDSDDINQSIDINGDQSEHEIPTASVNQVTGLYLEITLADSKNISNSLLSIVLQNWTNFSNHPILQYFFAENT